MSEPTKTMIFYTELDAIFDTRMGTLVRMEVDHQQANLKGIQAKGYYYRDRDAFFSVKPDQFKTLYDKRDQKTLQASMITPVVKFLLNFCRDTYEATINSPFKLIPKIVINTLPYRLSNDEKELIRKAVEMKIGQQAEVQMVEHQYSDITPMFLKANFVSMIALYEPYEWLEIHSKNENLKNSSCPLTMMLGPALIRNLQDSETKLAELREEMEQLAKPFINLQLLPIQIFSADVIRQKPKIEQTASTPA